MRKFVFLATLSFATFSTCLAQIAHVDHGVKQRWSIEIDADSTLSEQAFVSRAMIDKDDLINCIVSLVHGSGVVIVDKNGNVRNSAYKYTPQDKAMPSELLTSIFMQQDSIATVGDYGVYTIDNPSGPFSAIRYKYRIGVVNLANRQTIDTMRYRDFRNYSTVDTELVIVGRARTNQLKDSVEVVLYNQISNEIVKKHRFQVLDGYYAGSPKVSYLGNHLYSAVISFFDDLLNYKYASYLLDSNLSVVRTIQLPDSMSKGYPKMCMTPSGLLVSYVKNYTKTHDTYVAKISLTGGLLWVVKPYLDSAVDIQDIILCSDGSFLAVGSKLQKDANGRVINLEGTRNGFAAKHTSTGELKWLTEIGNEDVDDAIYTGFQINEHDFFFGGGVGAIGSAQNSKSFAALYTDEVSSVEPDRRRPLEVISCTSDGTYIKISSTENAIKRVRAFNIDGALMLEVGDQGLLQREMSLSSSKFDSGTYLLVVEVFGTSETVTRIVSVVN